MNITGIEKITYGVEDLDAAVRYHTDWGLALANRDDNGADFTLADASRLALRRADDAIEVDSTDRSIEEVFDLLLDHARRRGIGSG